MRRPTLRWLQVRSLRTRFAVWVAMSVLVAVIFFATFVYISTLAGLRGSLDDSLRGGASVALTHAGVTGGTLSVSTDTTTADPQIETLLAEGMSVRYLDASGALVQGFGISSEKRPSAKVLAAARRGTAVYSQANDLVHDRDFRVYTVPVRNGYTTVGFVQVLHDLGSVDDTLRELLAALLAGGAVVVVAGGLVGYFLARRALEPIAAITRTAKQISAYDLSARLNMPDTYTEVNQLAGTFDAMLERLDQSFARERRFTADASHELRTPLAAMETILGVVRSEPRRPAEYEQALDDLADETARLRLLTEDLMQLARGSRLEPADLVPMDLSTLLEDVTEALRPLAEAKELRLESRVAQGLMVKGDTDSLVRVFLNLLDNAIKFTERGVVTVSARRGGDAVVVDVADTGIGMAPGVLASIFERFYRADSSRSSPGAGLGLSLARQMVQENGGELTVASVEGRGSTFTVRLPWPAPETRPA